MIPETCGESKCGAREAEAERGVRKLSSLQTETLPDFIVRDCVGF